MWEVLLDALKDSAIALPFLLAIYLLIEFLESNKRAKDKTVKLLNGRLAPLVAGGVGLVPQCGFSVMATDLYCQNYLKTGTLIAFFVATSDEALPILLTNGKTVGVVWIVLLVKVVYAVALGYLINLFDRRKLAESYVLKESGCCHHEFADAHEDVHSEGTEISEHNGTAGGNPDGADSDAGQVAEQDGTASVTSGAPNVEDDGLHEDCEHGEGGREECQAASAHSRKHPKLARFWAFVKHPLLHTAKIFLYIFIVNFIFGTLMFYAEQPILEFTSQLGFAQCFITALLGLVPNCASSVIITGMYADGIISLSAMLAGLVSNSGIALAILFKQRKWKRNFGILGGLYLAGAVLGVASYFVLH